MLLLSSFYLVNVEMSHFLSRDQIKLTACYAANTLQAHNPFLPRNREPSNILANSPLSAMHIEEKCFIIHCCVTHIAHNYFMSRCRQLSLYRILKRITSKNYIRINNRKMSTIFISQLPFSVDPKPSQMDCHCHPNHRIS